MTATTDHSATDPSAAPAGAGGLLRAAFRRHAAGVAVITAAGSGPVGFTATSLVSVSAEPPLFSFGVGTGSSSWPAIGASEYVGVHLLGEHQRQLAEVFARPGADRFAAPTRWAYGPHGVPVLEGVPVWLVGRITARVPAGDHHVVIAEVVTGDPAGPGGPLLYHHGGFNGLRD